MERGLVKAADLEIALRNQLMLGGHIGSCLLELGVIGEDALGKALSEILHVPYAEPAVFENIEPVVVNMLSKKAVETFGAIPFSLQKNGRLNVAMMNPQDLNSHDALAFAAGRKIKVWFSPEARLFEAMEKLYGIPRKMRYIVIARSLSPLDIAADQMARDAQSREEPGGAEETIGGDEPTATPHGEEYGYGRSWHEVAEELHSKRPAEPEGPDGDLLTLAQRLCDANDRNDLARFVLSHLTTLMERAILMAVKKEEIRYWDSAGFELDKKALARMDFSLAGLSVLDHLRGEELYHGPLSRDPRHREFYASLGGGPPNEIQILPVHIAGKLSAIVIGDSGETGTVGGDPEHYRRLARMIGLGLNLVIFKRKIRDLVALETQAS